MYCPCPAVTLLLHVCTKQKSDNKGQIALGSLGQENSESSVAPQVIGYCIYTSHNHGGSSISDYFLNLMPSRLERE